MIENSGFQTEMQQPPTKHLKRFLKLIPFILSGIIVLLMIAALIITVFYEKKVKEIIVAEIEKQIIPKIQIESLDFSLIRKFPYASLHFKNVIIFNEKGETDGQHFLIAKSIYFKFKLFDLFSEQYKIRKIQLNYATLNLRINKDGTDNYHILRKHPEEPSKEFSLNLQSINFKHVEVNYHNLAMDQNLSLLIENSNAKGKFTEKEYELKLESKVFINSIKAENQNIINNKNVELNVKLHVDQETQKYEIINGDLNLNDSRFAVSGHFIFDENSNVMNIALQGKNLKINKIIHELSKEHQEYLSKYTTSGNFYFDAKINGEFGEKKMPLIIANFGVVNGSLKHEKSGISLQNLYFKADYSNGELRRRASNTLSVKGLSAKFLSGKIDGDIFINNFVQPEIEISLYSILEVANLKDFLDLDKFESLAGTLKLNCSFKTKLQSDSSFTAKDFINSHTLGNMSLSNCSFKLKDNLLDFNNFNGQFAFSNNDIIVEDLNGKVSKSDIDMKGYFRNILSYIFLNDQKLQIDARIQSNYIDLNELLGSHQTKKTSTGSYNFTVPDQLEMKGEVSAKKMIFRKFIGEEVESSFKVKNSLISVGKLNFKSMDGRTSAQGFIDGSKQGKLLFSCDATIKLVDIQKMFYEFENFGQSSMTDKNLKGVLTSSVQFAGIWSNTLNCDLNSIFTRAEITIENGELNDYEPLKDLSKFLKVEDLSKIKFSTLSNIIEIKNQVISIPKMVINSNAIDITASGTHTFNNDINYHLQLLWSDVLWKKAKSAKKENNEFGEVMDDGLGRTKLFIAITGTVDNPRFKYDSAGLTTKLKEDIKTEKQNLKQILNEEFGWFKKDTSFVNYETEKSQKKKDRKKEKEQLKKQEKGEFIIDFDDDL